MPSIPADIPQTAKDAQRTRFLKKRNKRRATRVQEKKQDTERVTKPQPLKKAKKIKQAK